MQASVRSTPLAASKPGEFCPPAYLYIFESRHALASVMRCFIVCGSYYVLGYVLGSIAAPERRAGVPFGIL